MGGSLSTPCRRIRPQDHAQPCGPPCPRYEEPTLIYSPSGSGLGNTLLSFASFAALAGKTKRKVVLQWERGDGLGAQAGYLDMFTDGFSNMVQPRCDPHIPPKCILEFKATPKLWSKVLRLTKGDIGAHLRACPTIWATGNAYFAPLLRRLPRHSQFGALSRRLFAPRPELAQAADRFVASQTHAHADALIALHVRESHLSGSVNLTSKQWSFRGSNPWRTAPQFLRCLARVQRLALAAGYGKSRVYVAADQLGVRERAKQLIGPAALAPPHCGASCINGTADLPNDVGLMPSRGAAATVLALEELLVLARSDALLVWDLHYSTFSAVAAAWAAHGAGGQPPRARPRLGIFLVGRGGNCTRVPDGQVEPPLFRTRSSASGTKKNQKRRGRRW